MYNSLCRYDIQFFQLLSTVPSDISAVLRDSSEVSEGKELVPALGELCISNWFITSCVDNWVLKELRDLLYHYWNDYDSVVDYYMFHLFFGIIMEKHPEVAAKMPRYGNRVPHCLSRRMGDKYDEAWMLELKEHSCFHKLSYRLGDKVLESKGTFYDEIINKNIYGIN